MTHRDIDYLISKSGEMEVENLAFDGEILSIRCFFSEIDEYVHIKIKTKKIYCGTPEDGCGGLKKCHIKIDTLGNLESESGFYMPSDDFGQRMKETKSHQSMVYGLKCQSCKLFKIMSDVPVVTCVISDVDDVEYQLEVK